MLGISQGVINEVLIVAGFFVTLVSAGIGFALTRKKIQEIHVLVNSNLATVMNRVNTLTRTLVDKGIELPADADDA